MSKTETETPDCNECGSDMKPTYYDHDGSLEGYRCENEECWNFQEKVILVEGEECPHCRSDRIRKAFDNANRWILNRCMDCGAYL